MFAPAATWRPVVDSARYPSMGPAWELLGMSIPKWAHVVILPITDIDLFLLAKDPYASEILGIAKTLGVHPGDVLGLNLVYEATAYCTSIIAQDEKGNLYHGRNLDYNFADILRNLTVDLNFIKGGQPPRAMMMILKEVGGTQIEKYQNNEQDGKWWENAIYAFLKRSSPVSWLIRDTLNNAKDFQSAVLHLSVTPIIAETYYIMAGTQPKEGVVITRNRNGPADIWPLDPLYGEWFHVETNYDHWTNPPPTDDRRTPAIKAMNATGQANITLDSLYRVNDVLQVLSI
ncbi:N-acylethanolamine-hydrolyzing acid amidase-like [Pelobates fuscus]|uniref:N-acylethanolamine-hydrolyzing acid amidase-like n=1 Tax=Pelobates fuscus TaxID=191477 RepID=UPI002FE48CAB